VSAETEKILRGFAYMALGDGHATVPRSIGTSADAKRTALRLLADYDLPDDALIFEDTAVGLSIRANPEHWGGFAGYPGTDAAP
jgi:hypothetical protein